MQYKFGCQLLAPCCTEVSFVYTQTSICQPINFTIQELNFTQKLVSEFTRKTPIHDSIREYKKSRHLIQ